MVWAWLAAAGPAQAQQPRGDVDALVEELVPVVETRTGRRFVHVPSAGIASQNRLETAVLVPPPVVLPSEWQAPAFEPTLAERRHARYRLEHATAIYVPGSDAIYVVEESLRGVVGQLEVDARTLDGLMRCFVVHELVHALQHQYGVDWSGDDDSDLGRGADALREGHATHVAEVYCRQTQGDAIANLMEASQGVQSEASLEDDDPAVPYAWGRILTASLEAEDPELVWAAMLEDPPPLAAVRQAVRPSLVPGWTDPGGLRAAIGAVLDTPAWTRGDAGRVQTHELAWALGPDTVARDLPRSRAGWLQHAEHGGRHVMAMALWLPAGQPAALLTLRRKAVQDQPRSLAVFIERVGDLKRAASVREVGALRDGPRGIVAMEIQAPTADHVYREVWAAAPEILVIVAAYGPEIGRTAPQDATGVAFRALPQRPAGRFDPAPLTGWLVAVRARRAQLTPTTSWIYRMHRAAVALGTDAADTACHDAFADVLEPAAVPDPRPWAEAAFQCAASRDEVALATRARGLVDGLEAGIASYHGAKLAEKGRYRDVVAVLDQVPADDPNRGRTRELRLLALVELGQWSAAHALAMDGADLHPQSRAWAAGRMFRAGQRTYGRQILAQVCPELDPAEQAKCNAYLP